MDFEAMKVSNLGGGAATELPESAECFSAFAVVGRGLSNDCSRVAAAAVDVLVLKNRRFLASCPMRII